jgi:hypothetical protein
MNVTVDGVEVDMDASQVGISYAIGDPLDPGTISGNRSTTFKFPATNKVRAQLGGTTMSERPVSDDPLLRIGKGGVVYLEQVIRPIEWDRDEVRAVTVGNNAGWISDLKNLKLNELPLGESGRIVSSLIISSWYDEDALLYFPMIDYGYPWNAAIAAVTEDFRPGLRCHRLLKEAFAQLGYSLKVTGRLNNVWKKYVLPCTEEFKVGQRYIDENTLTVEQTTQSVHQFIDYVPQALPSTVDTVTDIGGNLFGTNAYEAPLLMSVSTKISFAITPIFGVGTLEFVLYDVTTLQNISGPYAVFLTFAGGQQYVEADVELGVYQFAPGTRVGVRARFIPSVPAFPNMFLNIDSFKVVYTPTAIPYQQNITVDIPAMAPDLSAWDVLQGINYNRCLSFDTDDRTKVVTVSYYEDKYQPIANGLSLIGREDHTDAPVKGNPLKTKRVVFGWKDDADDYYLELADASAGARGYGGLLRDIEGGTLPEKKVTMPFAATAMRVYQGGIFIPVMREQEVRAAVPGEEDRNFERTPRLLLADGVAFSDVDGWELDGAPMSVYPKCFFVRPGETDLCMAFGPENLYGSSGPGMVASHYGPYLRRLEKSKRLSIDLLLFDHEMRGLDFGVPVEVRSDFGDGWYYFTEIKRKQFGKDVPTRCDLIQV